MYTGSFVLTALLVLAGCDVEDDGGGGGDRDGAVTPGRDGATTPTPPPTAGRALVGEPCSTATDCAEPPRATCFTTVSGGGFVPDMVFPGGYCSRGCDESEGDDCGGSGTCATLSSAGGMISSMFQFCAKPCTTEADCRNAEGYRCHVVFPGFPGVCVPPGL